MEMKILRKEIYEDIQEVLNQELRIIAKKVDEGIYDVENYWDFKMKLEKEYYEWEKDLMLTCDIELKEKFSWIRMMAKKSRSEPAYYLTYPRKFFDL